MSSFSGEYEGKVDAKGRMVLPSRMKACLPEEFANEIVVKRGFEPCLVVYSMLEWKKVFDKVSGLNEFNKEARNFQRNFLRGSSEVELDSNARFVIPKSLMKYAEIDKEVIVVGVGNRMEIWNPDKYDEYLMTDQDEFSDIAEKFLADKPKNEDNE